jgi:hypothetical protein
LKSRDSGALYGASLRYAVAEQTTLLAAVSENLTPNGTGGVAQTTTVALGATHRFGERLTGRFGAGFLRTTFPSALADSTERTYSGDVGLSYALAERWNLEGGYRYLRSQYSQNGQQPRSSVVSLTLSYNWPGASLSTRTTLLPDYSGMPGAGPASVSQHPSGAPDLTGVQPAPGEQPRSPFEPYSLP